MIINNKIISRELQGETVLLNKENGDYFSLNNMGTEVFNYICSGMDTDEIIDLLFSKYEVEYDKLKTDILSLLEEMKEKNILMEE